MFRFRITGNATAAADDMKDRFDLSVSAGSAAGPDNYVKLRSFLGRRPSPRDEAWLAQMRIGEDGSTIR
jgi:hypothetical protein